eukprot:6184640-Pleurochrysis_carterae.AAC.1
MQCALLALNIRKVLFSVVAMRADPFGVGIDLHGTCAAICTSWSLSGAELAERQLISSLCFEKCRLLQPERAKDFCTYLDALSLEQKLLCLCAIMHLYMCNDGKTISMMRFSINASPSISTSRQATELHFHRLFCRMIVALCPAPTV